MEEGAPCKCGRRDWYRRFVAHRSRANTLVVVGSSCRGRFDGAELRFLDLAADRSERSSEDAKQEHYSDLPRVHCAAL
jgi:hypothetical protein